MTEDRKTQLENAKLKLSEAIKVVTEETKCPFELLNSIMFGLVISNMRTNGVTLDQFQGSIASAWKLLDEKGTK